MSNPPRRITVGVSACLLGEELRFDGGHKRDRFLAEVASRGRHANVLQHLAGFVRRELEGPDRQEFHSVVAEYAQGRIPIAVPLVLLSHHLRHYPDEWANAQVYLEPYPPELGLRGTV